MSASLEDYLEAIFNLAAANTVARSKDISEMLDVSKASVTGALRALAERELVNYKPYGYITLTDEGERRAAKVARKHEIIRSFFVDILGVRADKAHEAACKAEHAFGPEIVDRLLGFMDFVTAEHEKGLDLAGQFREFCRDNGVGGQVCD